MGQIIIVKGLDRGAKKRLRRAASQTGDYWALGHGRWKVNCRDADHQPDPDRPDRWRDGPAFADVVRAMQIAAGTNFRFELEPPPPPGDPDRYRWSAALGDYVPKVEQLEIYQNLAGFLYVGEAGGPYYALTSDDWGGALKSYLDGLADYWGGDVLAQPDGLTQIGTWEAGDAADKLDIDWWATHRRAHQIFFDFLNS